MSEKEAYETAKKWALMYGYGDKHYQPASWIVVMLMTVTKENNNDNQQ